ncbi:hypothetical protein [Treponema zioleckii]|uniref:hypothetical protein n=1 Tax=Treponema zioleckii TaxID=331680 RepID=UPI00168B63C2|nr:hypothetical protein [Treponema zioleckii]
MKKTKLYASLLSCLAVAGSGAFALDVDAKFNIEGNLANGGKGTSTRFIEINEQEQKNTDGFIVNVNGEKAGGMLSMIWTFEGDKSTDTSVTTISEEKYGQTTYTTTLSDFYKANVAIRRANVWFKPADWVKITAGTFIQHLYWDHMRWWQDVYGNKIGKSKWMNYREGSGVDSGFNGAGLAVEFKPVPALSIELAAAPGTSDSSDDTAGAFWNWDGNTAESYLAWGATAKYQISDKLSAGVAYADNGLNKYKMLSVGFEVGRPFGSLYYAFIQPRFYFGDKHNSEIGSYGYDRDADVSEYALTGIAIDNMLKLNIGEKGVLKARLPLVIRLTDEDDDPSYFICDVEFDYNMDGFTPYIEVNNGNRIYAPLMFGSEDGYTVKDSFAMDVRPGVKFNFGKGCEVFTGVDVYFGPGLTKRASNTCSFYKTGVTDIGWRIPFGATIKF